MNHGYLGHGNARALVDFRRRFWFSVVLTISVRALSPAIRNFLGLQHVIVFASSSVVLFGLSAIVFGYGGWPFLSGLVSEVSCRWPGNDDVDRRHYHGCVHLFERRRIRSPWQGVLLGIGHSRHWIEMKSVMSASRTLKALFSYYVRQLTASGHAKSEDVPATSLRPGDHIAVRPGERVPTDGIIITGRSSFNEAMSPSRLLRDLGSKTILPKLCHMKKCKRYVN
jgi:Cu2+-exporting ATPase